VAVSGSASGRSRKAARGQAGDPVNGTDLWRASADRGLQIETAAELDALLPAILDRAFKGEL